jgi:2'-5' RNA ligase
LNYPLTIRFIGDVDGATARDFTDALSRVELPPFALQAERAWQLRRSQAARDLRWHRPLRGLTLFAEANERAARAAGLPPEGRNFQPHVTLARLRNARAGAVACYLEHQGGIAVEPFYREPLRALFVAQLGRWRALCSEAAYPLED